MSIGHLPLGHFACFAAERKVARPVGFPWVSVAAGALVRFDYRLCYAKVRNPGSRRLSVCRPRESHLSIFSITSANAFTVSQLVELDSSRLGHHHHRSRKMMLTNGHRPFHLRELFIPVENDGIICRKTPQLPPKAAERQKLVHFKSCLPLIFFYYEKTRGEILGSGLLVA
jgi:hypothetical protein